MRNTLIILGIAIAGFLVFRVVQRNQAVNVTRPQKGSTKTQRKTPGAAELTAFTFAPPGMGLASAFITWSARNWLADRSTHYQRRNRQ